MHTQPLPLPPLHVGQVLSPRPYLDGTFRTGPATVVSYTFDPHPSLQCLVWTLRTNEYENSLRLTPGEIYELFES